MNAPANVAGPMPLPAELQARIAFGRAFLLLLDRGDLDTATLFAKAFNVQGAVLNGLRRRSSAR